MPEDAIHLASGFATAMHRLEPFEPSPALAVAVSGGADSMALAILTRDWAAMRGGSAQALVVDHGLRTASLEEARITIERLGQLGITARLLSLTNVTPGASMAERARIARYQVLIQACRDLGILHLLLGHHIADQAETLAMRVLQGSQTHGLAAMSAVRETSGVRLLRPLLAIEPASLRRFLTARDVSWVEDPSNHDLRATRARLRHRLANHPCPRAGLVQALSRAGEMRAEEENRIASELACRVTIRPEGFAVVAPGRISLPAFRSLLRTIGGQPYAASPTQIADLAARPRPVSLAGVRIMHAGRLGDGWLFVREEARVMQPIKAAANSLWDNRFRLLVDGLLPEDATIGKLGMDAAGFRSVTDLPSAVLRTLPAVRSGKVLAAVPHLGYASSEIDTLMTVLFTPPQPAAGATFLAAI